MSERAGGRIKCLLVAASECVRFASTAAGVQRNEEKGARRGRQRERDS